MPKNKSFLVDLRITDAVKSISKEYLLIKSVYQKIIYFCAKIVFLSFDDGRNLAFMSSDLTRLENITIDWRNVLSCMAEIVYFLYHAPLLIYSINALVGRKRALIEFVLPHVKIIT